LKYRPEIDGLRTVAVIPVILFHAGVKIFSGGFVGVDIFFVISGYLITTVLIQDIESHQFRLLNFYERRARRILPALFFVMFCCLPFAWLWMLPVQVKDFSQSLVAMSLFASNILFWRKTGYFAPAAEESPLLHTWSLSVEEQFYLIFPVFLILIWRFGRNPAFWSIVILSALSLSWSEWGWRNSPSANFYLAPSRAWELFAGSIAAFIINKRGVVESNGLTNVGLIAILVAIFTFDSATPFPSIYALLPVGGTVLIILYAGQKTWVAQMLSTRGFVGIGLISYSAYLWHQPLFAFARIRFSGETPMILMLALSTLALALAAVSWRYVEQPFRIKKSGKHPSTKAIFTFSAWGLMAFAAVGLVGHFQKGYVGRYEQPDFMRSGTFALPNVGNGYCFYDFNVLSSLQVGEDALNCRLGSRDTTNQVLLFGDSFAAHWEPFFDRLGSEEIFSLHSITTNWCYPAFSENSTAPRNHISRLQCAKNRDYVSRNFSNYSTIVLAGQWYALEDRAYNLDIQQVIDTIINNSRSKIILIDTPPLYERISVEKAIFDKGQRLIPNAVNEEASTRFWTALRSVYTDNDRVLFLSKEDLGFFDDETEKTEEGYPYSLDGGHISIYGALNVFDRFSEYERNHDLVNFINNSP
jgi:peptidoglycan/LPS O-acetylase OafA/YrhL